MPPPWRACRRSRVGFTCDKDGTLLKPGSFGIARCGACGAGHAQAPLLVRTERAPDRAPDRGGARVEPHHSGETCEQCGRRTVAIETTRSRTAEAAATLVLRRTTCARTWRQYR